MNPLIQLGQLRQSPWYDQISRSMLTTGELVRLVREDGIKGVTSNPTIFEKAIVGEETYADDLARLAASGRSEIEIYQSLVIHDIGLAADVLRPVYDGSNGEDGFVSLEVEPALAVDAGKTIDRAKELFELLDRPNVMIKVPATPQCMPAIEELIADGVNINVTLIFSLETYDEVMDAYIKGLRRRSLSGKAVDKVASVASFFVSRIDSAVERVLDARMKVSSGEQESERLSCLYGKVAVANAKIAYHRFKARFSGSEFAELRAQNARVQRPLWASTGTKNPKYSDVLYVESLIGPDTVNTMPPSTLQAFRNHGRVADALTQDIKSSLEILENLEREGISLRRITDELMVDGISLFTESFNRLIEVIRARCRESVMAFSQP